MVQQRQTHISILLREKCICGLLNPVGCGSFTGEATNPSEPTATWHLYVNFLLLIVIFIESGIIPAPGGLPVLPVDVDVGVRLVVLLFLVLEPRVSGGSYEGGGRAVRGERRRAVLVAAAPSAASETSETS